MSLEKETETKKTSESNRCISYFYSYRTVEGIMKYNVSLALPNQGTEHYQLPLDLESNLPISTKD